MAGTEGQGAGFHAAADAGGEDVPDAGRGSRQGPGRVECGEQDAAWWEPEPDVGRVATGIPARVDRLRGLGNAIVPQVAAELMRMICTANTGFQGTANL